MTDRQELARALAMCDDYDGCFERVDEWEATPEDERRDVEYPASDYEDCQWWLRRADVVLAAGYRKPRTITAVEELAPMPDGTVIIGPDGLVGEKRDFPLDLAVRYVNGTTETNHDIPMPVTVLWEPR